jgi:hypothetical protein
MRSTMPQDQLTRLITRYSRAAQEARQVAGRLAQLLDVRFTEIKKDHTRGDAGGEACKGADAVRRALVDPRWLETVDELVDLHARACEARVQYETHLMLHEARRSMRAFATRR